MTDLRRALELHLIYPIRDAMFDISLHTLYYYAILIPCGEHGDRKVCAVQVGQQDKQYLMCHSTNTRPILLRFHP